MSSDLSMPPVNPQSQVELELSSARQQIVQLQQEIERLQATTKASEVAESPIDISEFEETLKRLVHRVAMILQAEKCVILIADREKHNLIARHPAFGIPEHEVSELRLNVNEGVAGEVYRSGKPSIIEDALSDPRTIKSNATRFNLKNGVVVPLIVERRDDDNRVVEQIIIGDLCVFNKRYEGTFLDEDVTLLERLARNAAAVIANAQLYRDLVEEKEKLAHTIESLYAGLLLVGQNGRLLQMNARARQMFNVQDDPHGKGYAEVLPDERSRDLITRMLEAPETLVASDDDEEGHGVEEISVIDPETEEERVFQVHPARVRGEDGHLIGTAIILNDITDLRNLERMKTEFVAIAAHELRTPMTPIKGFISMLAQDEDDSFSFEDRKEYYQIIEQSVDRLGRLINDLLNVTRIERKVAQQLFWEEVDLCKLAEQAFEIQRGQTNTDKHSLVLDSASRPMMATVGRDQMEQILQNLVSNAIKYSPEGGEIRIIMREELTTDTVLVGVRDHGTGIPESARNKLFKPYRRIHNPQTASVKGTGIGLFLVKNLVEAHQGSIWVDTELGKGSTFWFRLPKSPSQENSDISEN